MKQKVVIKVCLNDKKTCTKAIKTAVGVCGVTQAALQQDKNQIEVTGDGIDVILLTTLLRKSLKYAELVSVSPVEEKKEAPKEKKEEEQKQMCQCIGGVPVICEVRDPVYYYCQDPCRGPGYNYCQDPCSIM